MASAAVAFDFDEVLPTVRRAHSRASLEDAEDAVQTAVAELLEKGTALTAPNVVTRARSRLIDRFKRREAGNASLDAALEDTEDHAPRDLAVDVVDFDAHAQLAEAADNPVLRLRLEAARVGSGTSMQPRGSASNLTRYSDETVAEARRLRETTNLSYRKIADRLGVQSEIAVLHWCKGHARTVPTRPGWSRDLILDSLRAFAREQGRSPRSTDLGRDRRLPNKKTFYRHFKRWADALAAAGLADG